MDRRADENTHAIHTLDKVLIIAMNEADLKTSQPKILAQTPHEVSSVRVWKLVENTYRN